MPVGRAKNLVEDRFYGGCSSVGRAPHCDSGCRGFERHQPRLIKARTFGTGLFPFARTVRAAGCALSHVLLYRVGFSVFYGFCRSL